jgi:hypothetical protein
MGLRFTRGRPPLSTTEGEMKETVLCRTRPQKLGEIVRIVSRRDQRLWGRIRVDSIRSDPELCQVHGTFVEASKESQWYPGDPAYLHWGQSSDWAYLREREMEDGEAQEKATPSEG